jgi:hypothetical protein
VNWREFRHLDANSTEVKRQIERFCMHIRDALCRPWVFPEESKERDEAAERQQTGAESQRQEAEAKHREKEANKERALAERKREEAERQRTERESRTEAEARIKNDAERKEQARLKEANARQRAEAVARSNSEAEEERLALKAGQAPLRSPWHPLSLLVRLVSVTLIATGAIQTALLIFGAYSQLYFNIGLDGCTDWYMSSDAGTLCTSQDMSWRTAIVVGLIVTGLVAGIVSLRGYSQLVLGILCVAGLAASLYCSFFTFWYWKYFVGYHINFYSGAFMSSIFVASLFFDVVAFGILAASVAHLRVYRSKI